VALTASSTLDAQKLRADFPIFEQKMHGKPLAYLDSAASSQKPRQVLDAIREFYETSYANVHRGVYTLSERATAGYEGARETARAFVNAPSAREVIFTRSATESINLVAYAWGLDNLGPGDVVLVTELTRTSCPGSTSPSALAPTSGCCRSTITASCDSTVSTSSRRATR
jgi:cysteine desulfurase/selenocysteine lyase